MARAAAPLPYFANNVFFVPVAIGAVMILGLLLFCAFRLTAPKPSQGRERSEKKDENDTLSVAPGKKVRKAVKTLLQERENEAESKYEEISNVAKVKPTKRPAGMRAE